MADLNYEKSAPLRGATLPHDSRPCPVPWIARPYQYPASRLLLARIVPMKQILAIPGSAPTAAVLPQRHQSGRRLAREAGCRGAPAQRTATQDAGLRNSGRAISTNCCVDRLNPRSIVDVGSKKSASYPNQTLKRLSGSPEDAPPNRPHRGSCPTWNQPLLTESTRSSPTAR